MSGNDKDFHDMIVTSSEDDAEDGADEDADEENRLAELRVNKNMRKLILRQLELKTYNNTLIQMQNNLLTDDKKKDIDEVKQKNGTISLNDPCVTAIELWYNAIAAVGFFSETNIEACDKTAQGKNITKLLKRLRRGYQCGKMIDVTRVNVISLLHPVLKTFFEKSAEQIKADNKINSCKRMSTTTTDNDIDTVSVISYVDELSLIRLMQHEINMESVILRQQVLKAKLKAI
jgi:hypothetical protein